MRPYSPLTGTSLLAPAPSSEVSACWLLDQRSAGCGGTHPHQHPKAMPAAESQGNTVNCASAQDGAKLALQLRAAPSSPPAEGQAVRGTHRCMPQPNAAHAKGRDQNKPRGRSAASHMGNSRLACRSGERP
jgi:hypothetical protein